MSNQTTESGIGFGGLLTVLFVGLKLTHYINWSWWWVLAPVWVPVAAVLGIWSVALVVCFLAELIK